VKAWLAVVSYAHVCRGVTGGFAQVCHGKGPPLRRLQAGDWLIYYSPSVEIGGAALRAFTAIGRVEDDRVFAFDMGGGFVPFRRRVRYLDATSAPLAPLAPRLELCARPSWGMALRRGLLPLSLADLAVVAGAMGVRLDASELAVAAA
jgi:EVE domain-containing protein